MDIMTLIVVAMVYVFAIVFLGWLGKKHTRTASDYIIAGRETHPMIMALSYGSTFISTSAIIGFGGVAAHLGLGLLWLTFLNIAVGIFLAFIIFGKRTRAMGHHLDAHTFPELLGRRYGSKFVQVFSGGVILTMVVYASVVMIGGAKYLQEVSGWGFDAALVVIALITIIYVITGGLKGVMYTDALQGVIMFVGMFVMLLLTLSALGGIGPAHEKLNKMWTEVRTADVRKQVVVVAGAQGLKISEVQAGQLAEQFGKVLGEARKAKPAERAAKVKELLAKVRVAGLAIGEKMGDLYKKASLYVLQKGFYEGQVKAGHEGWASMPASGSSNWWLLVSTIVMGVGIGVLAQPQLVVRFMTVKSDKELNRGVLAGGIFIVMMTGVAFVVGALSNTWFYENPATQGLTAMTANGMNVDAIMPAFLDKALPKWFNYLLMLGLLSAAMSTMSSQFHAMGTAISRDIMERMGWIKNASSTKAILSIRVGIFVMFIVTFILGYLLPDGYIAAGTALFFGLCASVFLPVYVGGLFWKRATREGAIASLVSGFVLSVFWQFFVHKFTVAKWGATSILGPTSKLSEVDPLFIAFPVSAVIFVVVSLLTKPDKKLTDHCFSVIGKQPAPLPPRPAARPAAAKPAPKKPAVKKPAAKKPAPKKKK